MTRRLAALLCAAVTSISVAQREPNDSVQGAMHFSAKALDLDGDGMISKDEFMTYHAAMWTR